MSKISKSTKNTNSKQQKKTIQNKCSTELCKQIWIFDLVDKDGEFAFDLNSPSFNHKLVLDKLFTFSQCTWSEIRCQTHDRDNKTCHHFLEYDKLSSIAKDRITKLCLEDETDAIYSMRLNNMIRIIGIRKGDKFIVKWYDANYKFCPSTKK